MQTSSYLGRVYREVFNEPLLSLAIYGWGIGGQEQHILDRIEAARPARVAVSVLGRDQTYADHAYQRFSAIGVRDIRFFDAASAGAWNKRANNIRLFCLVGDDGQPVGIHCVGSAGHEGMAFDLFSSESAAADQARDDELEFEMATNIRGISGRDLLALLSVADALYLDDNDIPLTFAGQLLLETNEVMDAVTALDTLESSKDA